MFQLVVLPSSLGRPEADHGYGPKCRTVYKTEYKGRSHCNIYFNFNQYQFNFNTISSLKIELKIKLK